MTHRKSQTTMAKSKFGSAFSQVISDAQTSTGMEKENNEAKPETKNVVKAVLTTDFNLADKEALIWLSINDLVESPSEHQVYNEIVDEDVGGVEGDPMDALARDIAKNGIQTPLRIIPSSDRPEKFEIVSGHRRYHAVKIAAKLYDFKDAAQIPCILNDAPKTGRNFEVLERLILDNLQRDRTDYERMNEIVFFKKCIEDRKEAGEDIVNVRNEVKRRLGVSDSMITRCEKIHGSLIPNLLIEFKKGNIASSVAYNIANNEIAVQEYIAENWNRTEAPVLQLNTVTELYNQFIKRKKDEDHSDDQSEPITPDAAAATQVHKEKPATKLPDTIEEGMTILSDRYKTIQTSLENPFKTDSRTKKRIIKKIDKMNHLMADLQNDLNNLGLLTLDGDQ